LRRYRGWLLDPLPLSARYGSCSRSIRVGGTGLLVRPQPDGSQVFPPGWSGRTGVRDEGRTQRAPSLRGVGATYFGVATARGMGSSRFIRLVGNARNRCCACWCTLFYACLAGYCLLAKPSSAMPTVSIVTPCYNAEQTIRSTIESVRAQQFTEWEHILVDDGSTDQTFAVLQELCDASYKTKLARQENKGVSAARNRGIARVSDESTYVLFLDADDTLLPNTLSWMVAYLEAYPDVGMVAGYPMLRYAAAPDIVRKWQPARYRTTPYWIEEIPTDQPETPPLSVFTGIFAIHCCLIRLSAYRRTCGFDPELTHWEDTDVFTQVALIAPVHVLDRPAGYYWRYATQATRDGGRLIAQRKRLTQKWGHPLSCLAPDLHRKQLEVWRQWHGRYVPHQWKHRIRENLWSPSGAPGALVRMLAGIPRWLYFTMFANPMTYHRIRSYLNL